MKKKSQSRQSSFYLSFYFLSPEKRRAIKTIYDFCRESDDRVDADLPTTEKQRLLSEWRQELERCYAGAPTYPLTQELAAVLKSFPVEKQYFQELLNGMEMDLHKNRYETFQELHSYCYRAASVVGLICLRVFDVSEQDGREYAASLGVALQLTNILRDVRTDLQRDRIYFPLEDFERFGYSVEDFQAGRMTAAGKEFFAFQINRAKEYFEWARRFLPRGQEKKLLSAEIMGAVYGKILQKIEDYPEQVFHKKVRVPKIVQVWTVLRTCFKKNKY